MTGLESHITLRFTESTVNATVFERISHSHPLKLRASYSRSVKLGTLVHELGHRLVYGARNPRVAFATARPSTEELHRTLDLFLFDVWTDLYGSEFAHEQVATECGELLCTRRRGTGPWQWIEPNAPPSSNAACCSTKSGTHDRDRRRQGDAREPLDSRQGLPAKPGQPASGRPRRWRRWPRC